MSKKVKVLSNYISLEKDDVKRGMLLDNQQFEDYINDFIEKHPTAKVVSSSESVIVLFQELGVIGNNPIPEYYFFKTCYIEYEEEVQAV